MAGLLIDPVQVQGVGGQNAPHASVPMCPCIINTINTVLGIPSAHVCEGVGWERGACPGWSPAVPVSALGLKHH